MKNLKRLFTASILTLSFASLALFGIGKDTNNKEVAKEKTKEECEIPAFAKAIGHEDLWLKHNGCPPREATEKEERKAEEVK